MMLYVCEYVVAGVSDGCVNILGVIGDGEEICLILALYVNIDHDIGAVAYIVYAVSHI